MSLARALYERWQVLVHEIAKFGIVGAINTVLHFGLFNLLTLQVGLGPLTSNGLAIAVAATSSYFMNREWTFRHRARRGVRREYTVFFVLNGVGLVISEACLGFTHYVLGFQGPLAANAALVAGVGLGTLFRFLTYKRWVFLAPEAPEPAGPVGAAGPQTVTLPDAGALRDGEAAPQAPKAVPEAQPLAEPGGDARLSALRKP